MNKISLALSLALATGCVFAAEQNFDNINKDMRIMSRILDTALSESRDKVFGSRVESRYLAKQGMVFEIHSNSRFPIGDGSSYSWAADIEASALQLAQSIVPAIAPLSPEDAEELQRDLEEELSSVEAQVEAESSMREVLADLREELRNRKDDYRDNLRELRRIESDSLRGNIDDDTRAELDKRRQQLNTEIAENKRVMEQYQQKMNEYRKQSNARLQERRSDLVNTTIATLCDYSASLRSLGSDEHVTLVFSNFSNSRDGKNLIYVFEKSAMKGCESDNDGVEKLKEKAISYRQ